MTRVHATELAELADLHPHEQNYRSHPEDQRGHITQSIREHGFYRNVVVANDGTILAGHGVVEAAREAGLSTIPVVRLAIAPDDPKALKILTGDNEIARLAMIDDRVLANLLRDIREGDDAGLLGTGYDDAMLANLVFVSRDESEIANRDDAAAWVGLPDFGDSELPVRLVVSFDTDADRTRFMETVGIETIHKNTRGVWSVWWPPREREDLASLRFAANGDGE
jgi:hypothetical protein